MCDKLVIFLMMTKSFKFLSRLDGQTVSKPVNCPGYVCFCALCGAFDSCRSTCKNSLFSVNVHIYSCSVWGSRNQQGMRCFTFLQMCSNARCKPRLLELLHAWKVFSVCAAGWVLLKSTRLLCMHRPVRKKVCSRASVKALLLLCVAKKYTALCCQLQCGRRICIVKLFKVSLC